MGHVTISGSNLIAFTGAFVGAVATSLVGYIQLHIPRIVRKDDEGWRHVVPGFGYQGTAVCFGMIAAFVCYAAAFAQPSQARIAHVTAALFVTGSLLLIHEAFIRKVRWNTFSLESRSVFGTTLINWNEVRSGSYVPVLDMAVVSDTKGRRIWVPPFGGAAMLWRYGRMRTGAFSLRTGMAFRARRQRQRRA
jgi:hypothetical protein